ncbi:MAG: AAA family ATPase [Omnitrophica bacterium GWA2_52_8]|nr:MAG: AAA family ATPase [Omnitrophica bacterium GWA2_52_8]
MRPRNLDEIVGQDHLLAPGKLLRRSVQSDRWTSMIIYGPPGSGKTTLARVISRETRSVFVPLNAVTSNVAELRKIILEAVQRRKKKGEKTILFVDEIHRFNKGQQDVLMPDVECGNVVLIGATTHNPSFAINGPLLSRSVIFELKPLEIDSLIKILKTALGDPERGYGNQRIEHIESALKHIAVCASGDARRALTALEVGVATTKPDAQGVIHITEEVAQESCQRRLVYYDGDEDYHYDTISAFIKSVRGSDVNAAVYWLAKMLYAGEDPRFIIRRLIILASEDIGNADPQGLVIACAALQGIEFVGMPEARILLAQVVTYLALAPKSNASYRAIEEALTDVKEGKAEEVPQHLKDASYKGAEKLGRGQGYVYSHDVYQGKSGAALRDQRYLDSPKEFYRPNDIGFEKILKERLKEIKGGAGKVT